MAKWKKITSNAERQHEGEFPLILKDGDVGNHSNPKTEFIRVLENLERHGMSWNLGLAPGKLWKDIENQQAIYKCKVM